ncbi:serine protease [Thalassococcus sp. BH17M4-6]|uniref:serine protease n=1 Tax=Thalassococcus sp. BH17M4-6 TaxID=3413148 RepID=UPI003BC33F84
MLRTFFIVCAVALWAARPALAQDVAFIQVEAQPSLTRAQDRARDYSSFLQDVNGFALGGGWYGIALGPYAPDEAAALLRQLRAQGQIPLDAYVADPVDFQRRFWPVGAGPVIIERGLPAATSDDTAQDVQAQQPTEPAVAEPVDESPREARRSEAALDGAARRELQVALKWAGYYTAAIDGAFGRGTRRSMSEWQTANGFEATGVLTTRQRAELLRQYNAVLDGMGLRQVTEARAGISMQLPMGVVDFEKYEAPFVHYAPTGDLDARVLLISQPGDQDTLFGLYEIMQTLEIVPLEGPRERRNRSFTLTGENARIVSHTEAELEDGRIKGFTLIWPAGDEERRTRVLGLMQDSFEVTAAVLDPAAVSEEVPSVDLVSGLQIRKPKVTASGFYVNRAGSVVTSSEAVAGCGRITLDGVHEAVIVAQDAALGIAVLRPQASLAPQSVAAFREGLPRLQTEVAVSGYSFGGVLSRPTLTYGTLEDLRGLSGEENLKRLALASLPGDAGGPVFDAGGAVLGMLLPRESGGRQLPEEVSFAAKADDIRAMLRSAGVTADATQAAGVMAPEDLTAVASEMTVLVSCWE